MGKILNYIILTSALIISICSCSSDGCLDNQSSIPLAGFYSSASKQTLALDSVEIYGIGAVGDSLLTNTGSDVSNVYLPFRATTDSTAFCLHYTYKSTPHIPNDTIWFNYETIPYFASEECGAMYKYKITSTRHTLFLIDSISVIDPEINNIDIERIKIYFKSN